MDLLTSGLLWWGSLAGLGFGVGVLSGLFGVGGGFLLTPLLVVLFRVPVDIAVGTGLCQMVGAAAAAQIRFSRLRQGEAKLAWMMAGGSLLGVELGARTVQALERMGQVTVQGRAIAASELGISLGYVLVLGAVGVWMALDTRRPSLPPHRSLPPGPLARVRIPPFTRLPRSGRRISITVVAYLGLGIGYLSGLLGIGGGVILLPLLLRGVGMRVRAAAGTSVGLLMATSLLGTVSHARLGHVDLGLAMTLLVGSSLGAQWGALMAARVVGHKLRVLFAVFVCGTAAAVAVNLARTLAAA